MHMFEIVDIDGHEGIICGSSLPCTDDTHPGYCASWKIYFDDGTYTIKDAHNIPWNM